MHTGAHDHYIVTGAQIVTPPHRFLLHSCILAQFCSSLKRFQAEGLQMKFLPGVENGLPHYSAYSRLTRR